MSDESDNIAVRCGGCKQIVFIAVNRPVVMDTEAFNEIGKMIRGGCSVHHVTMEQFKKEPFGCSCPKEDSK